VTVIQNPTTTMISQPVTNVPNHNGAATCLHLAATFAATVTATRNFNPTGSVTFPGRDHHFTGWRDVFLQL
jgi:hypothetical protein